MLIDNQRRNGQGATQNTLESALYRTTRRWLHRPYRCADELRFQYRTYVPADLFQQPEPMKSDLHHLFPATTRPTISVVTTLRGSNLTHLVRWRFHVRWLSLRAPRRAQRDAPHARCSASRCVTRITTASSPARECPAQLARGLSARCDRPRTQRSDLLPAEAQPQSVHRLSSVHRPDHLDQHAFHRSRSTFARPDAGYDHLRSGASCCYDGLHLRSGKQWQHSRELFQRQRPPRPVTAGTGVDTTIGPGDALALQIAARLPPCRRSTVPDLQHRRAPAAQCSRFRSTRTALSSARSMNES